MRRAWADGVHTDQRGGWIVGSVPSVHVVSEQILIMIPDTLSRLVPSQMLCSSIWEQFYFNI